MLRRRLSFILLFSLFMVLVFAVCGCSSDEPAQSETETDTSWQDIKEKGYFVVGLDDAFPPMGFREEGTNEIVGFDIDLAKEAAKRMGVEVKFQPVIWDTIIEELNSGNVDVIWNGLTITEERQQKIAFTEPYLENRQIIVVQKDSAINSKKDLAGKNVGRQAGSSAKIAMEKDPETLNSIGEIFEYGSNDEALLDLSTGRLDAVVVDEIVGRYYITKKPDVYRVLDEHFGEELYGVGLRKGDKSFLDELQKTLDEMKADGTAAEISKKWFGEDLVI